MSKKQEKKMVPDIRSPGFEGEWEEKRLGNFFSERSEIGNFDDLPMYSLTIKDGVIPKPNRYIREHLVKSVENAYKRIMFNDFVYNPMNLRFGALKVHKDNYPVRVSKYYDTFYTHENIFFWENYLVTYNTLCFYD